MAKQLEAGAVKYGERNWELGQPLSWYADSGMRHWGKHMAGYRDERHDVAAAWNVLSFIDTVVRIEEGLLPLSLDDVGHFSEHQREEILRRHPKENNCKTEAECAVVAQQYNHGLNY